MSPRVTVVMPAYNASQFIDTAISSIRAQTMTDWEMLVVNDGSTDDTALIAERHARQDRRIRVLHQANSGQAAANNLAIPKSRADLIARMDADDLALPERLESLCEVITRDPMLAAVGSRARCIAGDAGGGGIYGESGDPRQVSAAMRNGGYCPLLNPTALFRKSAWLAVGGERACFGSVHDVDLWMRIGASMAIRIVPDILLEYRVHDGNVSLTGAEFQGLALLAAYHAARIRRAGKPDPFLGRNALIDYEALLNAGCTRAECEAAILDSLGGQLALGVLAGSYGRARKLLRLIEDRRSCSDNPSRQAVQESMGHYRLAAGERNIRHAGRALAAVIRSTPGIQAEFVRMAIKRVRRAYGSYDFGH
jgi:glycosyltransferase involved in cell wall biosynthesis